VVESASAVNKQPPSKPVVRPVGLYQAFLFWLKLGFISFGGPAGQISI
jgi:chromate transporter